VAKPIPVLCLEKACPFALFLPVPEIATLELPLPNDDFPAIDVIPRIDRGSAARDIFVVRPLFVCFLSSGFNGPR